MSSRTNARVLGAIAGTCLIGGLLGGCSSGDPNYSDVRWNISPDMMTLTDRPVDVDRKLGYTFDTNYRMFWGDLQRAALLDRPSHLAREPFNK